MKKNSASAFRSYGIGFVLSVLATLAAYIPVHLHSSSAHSVFSHEILIPFLICLAVVQLLIQLKFFLHLGSESSPRWNLIFFVSAASIILLVVIGSLWIMHHLNYNMMPGEMEEYLLEREGIHTHK